MTGPVPRQRGRRVGSSAPCRGWSRSAHIGDDLDSWLDEGGITLAFAELKGVVRDRVASTPSGERIEFYPSVEEAVEAYVATGAVGTVPEGGA